MHETPDVANVSAEKAGSRCNGFAAHDNDRVAKGALTTARTGCVVARTPAAKLGVRSSPLIARTVSIVALLLAVVTAPCEEALDPKRIRDQQVLHDFGVAPTPDAALAYLESLIPAGDPNAVADALIRQLGDDEFERRELAATRLLSMPSLPRGKLELALQSSDPEIRWRSRVVLGRLGTTGNRAMLAALREVGHAPPPRAVEVLVHLAALDTLEPQQIALQQTLNRIVKESHVAQLQQASAEGPVFSRVAAANALQRLSDERGRNALAVLLDNDNPRAGLLAARSLGNVGDRRSLAALSRLLQSDDVAIANESANFVSALVGKDFGYSPYGDSASRSTAAAEMRRWLANEGANAALTFPVAEPVIVRGDLAGHTLVACGNLGHVIELDAKGTEIWRFHVISWSAEKLPNGNVLIAGYQANQILEVNKHGTIVWSRGGINAMRAKPLIDGHILVSDFQGCRVVELNEDRQEIWSIKTPENCFDAERLPNGNTVFCCPNLIREVDGDGNAARELKIEGRANSVQVLANGHWLIANFQKNQVQEYDRGGKMVWSFEETTPCDALKLRNGKILVTSNRRGIEIAPDGKTVREIAETKYGCVRQ